MSRKLRPLAALAMVVLIGVGCSNTPAETGTGSSGGNKNATNRDKTVKFAECMRENGVTEFPDPNASGDQEFVDRLPGSGITATDRRRAPATSGRWVAGAKASCRCLAGPARS
jgi:hypothetical protein